MKVTFKTAKIAKEKGFDLPCNNGFSPLGEELDNSWKFVCNDSRSIPRPTQSELQDWILENFGIFVTVELAYNEWGRYSSTIYKKSKDGVTAIIAIDGMTIFDNPQEALEEGLFEALELIPLTVRFPMYREEIYVTKI